MGRGLSLRLRFAIVQDVNHFRRWLMPFAAILLFGGCQTQTQFTRLRVTNYRDEIVSEWTAKGRVVPLGRGGYSITAVERTSSPPYRVYTRYPDGWPTTVQGPHIRSWRCGKPAWLAELDGDLLP